mmetsp:Transcript_121888/g.350342  ORF Transcript_121888/g.350342 Transcript_121888/m.350342 type:complete len:217 (+) Transcript_121888:139-789(+)
MDSTWRAANSDSASESSPTHVGGVCAGSDRIQFSQSSRELPSGRTGDSDNCGTSLKFKLNASGTNNEFTSWSRTVWSSVCVILPPKTPFRSVDLMASQGSFSGSNTAFSPPISFIKESITSRACSASASVNSYFSDQPLGTYRSLSWITACVQANNKYKRLRTEFSERAREMLEKNRVIDARTPVGASAKMRSQSRSRPVGRFELISLVIKIRRSG